MSFEYTVNIDDWGGWLTDEHLLVIDWCDDNLMDKEGYREWGFDSNTVSMLFKYEDDATAFKLKFCV